MQLLQVDKLQKDYLENIGFLGIQMKMEVIILAIS